MRRGDRIGVDGGFEALLEVLRGHTVPATGEILCTNGVRIGIIETLKRLKNQ